MDIQFLFQEEAPSLICNRCIKQLRKDYDEGALFDEHYHELYEILFVRSGNITYQIGTESFRLVPNTLVFTRPGMVHRLGMDAETVYDRYDFVFQATPQRLPLLQQIPEHIHVMEVSSEPMILQLFDRLDYYCRLLSGQERQQILASLLDELLLNMVILCRKSDNRHSAAISELLQKALAYIDAHLLQITDIDALCASLGISKSNLHRMFTQELDSTPKRYIKERRLTMAKWEISSGSKASAIYEKYGYTDYSAFFRAYSKQFGYAPSETKQSAFSSH